MERRPFGKGHTAAKLLVETTSRVIFGIMGRSYLMMYYMLQVEIIKICWK